MNADYNCGNEIKASFDEVIKCYEILFMHDNIHAITDR